MIYLDSSAVLARIFAEDRMPDVDVWQQSLVSSRLLEYEVWTRIHSLDAASSYGNDVEVLIGLIDLIELDRSTLARALKPFPVPVRTLDGLHLATAASLLHSQQEAVELLSYDKRMLAAARAMGIAVYEGT